LTTDEIHEKYLRKAISEINELAHEVAQAAGEARVPVVGTGHPLADIMLVKYRPRPTEAQEGVAFYGRSGTALIKSLQRLRVDPLAVYGTNCLKFADGEDDECRPWLVRELHIVQPKLVVVMGDDALGFVDSLDFPLARPLEPRPGELQQFTPTIDAIVTPDIDQSLDEQAEKTRFWNAFKLIGSWWAELPPY
jgi:uracil-DNA glycosylase family 4